MKKRKVWAVNVLEKCFCVDCLKRDPTRRKEAKVYHLYTRKRINKFMGINF